MLLEQAIGVEGCLVPVRFAQVREKRAGIFHVVVAPSGGVIGEAAGSEHHAISGGVDGFGDAEFAESKRAIEFGFWGFEAQVALHGRDVGAAGGFLVGEHDFFLGLVFEASVKEHGEDHVLAGGEQGGSRGGAADFHDVEAVGSLFLMFQGERCHGDFFCGAAGIADCPSIDGRPVSWAGEGAARDQQVLAGPAMNGERAV